MNMKCGVSKSCMHAMSLGGPGVTFLKSPKQASNWKPPFLPNHQVDEFNIFYSAFRWVTSKNALNCLEWFRTLVAFSGPLLSRPATITFPFSWHLLSRTTWPALIEEQYRTMATMGAFYVSYVLQCCNVVMFCTECYHIPTQPCLIKLM